MYMILAAQFESFLHPITILLALPLSLPFALLSLLLLGEPLNIYSILGLFMLFGIVKKNGILQIDYTNTLRDPGHGARRGDPGGQPRPPAPDPDDDRDAGGRHDPDRPRARARAPAARASMAKVIIGGQMLCLLLTLLLTPVAYSLFDDLGRMRLGSRIADALRGLAARRPAHTNGRSRA